MNRQRRNNEDKARQRNVYARKHLQSDLDAQRDMERVHLQTIRNEKIRLQKELERMRNKGQYMVKRHGASNHTQRLLNLRFTNEPSQDADSAIEGMDQDYESRVGLPDIDQSKKSKYGEYLPKKMNTQELQMTREERLRELRRKEAEKRQVALVARVGKLADEFREKQDGGGGGTSLVRRRRSVSPVENSDAKSEGAQTSKSDSFYTAPRRGMQAHTRTRTSSTIDVSLSKAKTSVARRLLPAESTKRDGDEESGGVNTRKISSHVMPIDAVKKTNTLPSKAEELVFDQDMFAPDGQVRTVHLLPDAEEAFSEAKKARYLRRTGPDAMDKELTVGEMFAYENVDDQTI